MLRKYKVYNELKKCCSNITYRNLIEGKIDCITTKEIAENLDLKRSNVSHDLNQLVKEDKVLRIKSRPVLFFDKEILLMKFNEKIDSQDLANINELIMLIKKNKKRQTDEEIIRKSNDLDFSEFIGFRGSLKEIVEQGKASILYPPNGLNMLLTGATGVGKTLFAKILFNFGKKCGKYNENTPFVMFNCADYANNCQLLLSQLFGHVKGAYTGATNDKVGLVEKANGGILFLDEIHRLPQEGQEMFFSIIDHGTFRRLGESENSRKTNVLIIGATTEEISEVLLRTFKRRIPIMVEFPNLKDRPLCERESLVKHFFIEESKKVKKEVLVPREIIAAFILYDCPGNIGQLKSDIQQVCAKAYLNYITKRNKEIKITRKLISESINTVLQNIYTYITSKGNDNRLVNINGIWSTMDDKDKRIFQNAGENLEKIDIELYNIEKVKEVLKEFIDSNVYNNLEKEIKKIPSNIIDFAKFIRDYIDKITGIQWGNDLIIPMSLYLFNFIKEEDQSSKMLKGINELKKNSNSYDISNQIEDLIRTKLGINIYDEEANILCSLLDKYHSVYLIGNYDNSYNDTNLESKKFEQEILSDAYRYIKDTIVFVNPYKLYPIVLNAIRTMQIEFYNEFSISHKLRLLIHISFSVERLLQGVEVPHKDVDKYNIEHRTELNKIKNSLLEIENIFNVRYTNHELSYIYDIFK